VDDNDTKDDGGPTGVCTPVYSPICSTISGGIE
jgi:hypothetical protein